MRKRIPNVSRFIGRLGFALVVFGVALSIRVSASPAKTSMPSSSYWIANTGQWEGDFQYKCEVGNAVYYVTPKGMTVDFREFHRYPKAQDQYDPMDRFDQDREQDSVTISGHVVQIHYVGAGSKLASGEELLSHYSNYFLGRDSTHWRSRVPHYQTVVANEVWPGINVEYRADKQGVETIYHVSPGADPTQIQIDYLGLDAPLRIDAQGNLNLTTSLGEVKEQAPYAYQMDGRVQKRIESTYHIIDNNRVAFEFERFDANKELVIDPLLYGTYLGGGNTDDLNYICLAPDGGVYVAGSTYALSGFPTTPGAYDETGDFAGRRNFVSRFGPEGEFVASTLFGEIQTQENPNTDGGVYDLVYDTGRQGIWICGFAFDEWPLTPDAYDSTIGTAHYDGYFLRFSEDLTNLEYSSYLGGSLTDQARGIKVDAMGHVYVVGETSSSDFPVTADALFPTRQALDGFLWVYDPDLHEVLFSTFFGGERNDSFWRVELGQENHIWLNGKTNSAEFPVTEGAFKTEFSDTGQFDAADAFLSLITLDPPTIEYCSYLGGDERDELVSIIEVDSFVYLSGRTFSSDFPVTSGAADTIGVIESGTSTEGFVSRLNWVTGEYAGTFIGGSNDEIVLTQGNWAGADYVIVSGTTNSGDFQVTSDAFDMFLNNTGQPPNDGFVTKLSADLTRILYSTYIGGSGDDIYRCWAENSDSVWLAGTTLSTDLPTTPDALQPSDNALTSGFIQHFAIDTSADTTSIVHNAPVPNDFSLTIFPNPFNPTTTLSFNLPSTSEVVLAVHDVLGREVAREHLGRLSVGQHEYSLDGSTWASGIYFVTLDRNSIRTSVKLVLVK